MRQRQALPGVWWAVWCTIGVAVWFGAASGQTQDATATGSQSVPVETLESIDKKIADVDSLSVDDPTKAKLREYYQQTKQELEQHAHWLKQKVQFEQRAATAAERMETVRESPEAFDYSWAIPPPTATIGELESLLTRAQSEQKQLEEKSRQLEEEPQRRTARRLEISRDTASLRQQIAELEAQLAAEPDAAEPPVVAQARRSLLSARLLARRTQLAAWEAELAAYEAEKELLPLERAAVRAQLAAATQVVEDLTPLVAQRRASEVEQRRDRAQRLLRQAPAPLQQEAQKNVRWSDEALLLTQELSRLEALSAALRTEKNLWQERVKKTTRRVETVRSSANAAALRQDRATTAERLSSLRSEILARSQRIEQLQEQLEKLQDSLDQVANADAAIQRVAQELGFARSPDEEPTLRRQLADIIQLRRELLADLTTRTVRLFELNVEVNDTAQELYKELSDYAQFIDRRILWMKSDHVVGWTTIRDVGKGIRQVINTVYRQLTNIDSWWLPLREEWKANYLMHLVWMLVLFLLLRYRCALRHRLGQLGEIAVRGNCIQYWPTWEALLITVLITLPWPLFFGYIGWRVQQVGGAAGYGLVAGAGAYGALEFVRQMCRPRGLWLAHFGWSERVAQILRAGVRWYAPLAAVLCLIVVGLHHASDGTSYGAVERLTFLLWMGVTAWLLHLWFRPKGGVFQEYLAFHAGGWVERLSMLWHPALVLIPILFAALALWGYYYTAWQLSVRGAQTGVLIEGLVVAAGLLHRLLLLSRRRLAIQQAKQRQVRPAESGEQPPEGPSDGMVDLAAINLQSRRLVQSGLVIIGVVGTWLIWSDVLPALAVLQEIRIYPTEGVQVGVIEWVTLADLLLAGLIAVMTTIAARNIPGLIEIFLLQRLPLDSATRYAVATLSRYMIALTGIVAICSTLGVSWRRAQWLVAALGVGLGFGLQEIFANFVSGLILLFERPIRVGDIITLGDVTGTVTRIRIRATTVRDWDGKELIVPNKDLITGRLLNWTLSDTKNRIVIRVGIAYGSDVQLAQALMLRIAQEHPAVLADPAPTVTFEEFGNSALQMVLRAHLGRLDQRLPCIHDLHLAIDRAFREHNIQIPYPQMDVHVRYSRDMTGGGSSQ